MGPIRSKIGEKRIKMGHFCVFHENTSSKSKLKSIEAELFWAPPNSSITPMLNPTIEQKSQFYIQYFISFFISDPPSPVVETIKAGVIRHTSQPSHSLAYIIRIQKKHERSTTKKQEVCSS